MPNFRTEIIEIKKMHAVNALAIKKKINAGEGRGA
jgi:hypothetical protein